MYVASSMLSIGSRVEGIHILSFDLSFTSLISGMTLLYRFQLSCSWSFGFGENRGHYYLWTPHNPPRNCSQVFTEGLVGKLWNIDWLCGKMCFFIYKCFNQWLQLGWLSSLTVIWIVAWESCSLRLTWTDGFKHAMLIFFLPLLNSSLIYPSCVFQVPRSSKKLHEDNEYALYTVTLFKRVADNFRTNAREKGFQVSSNQFDLLELLLKWF
jgi:hypothetical protein